MLTSGYPSPKKQSPAEAGLNSVELDLFLVLMA
jgi:hypothetical protein